MSTNKRNTLAEKIAGILSAQPASFDPEDDPTDTTRANLSIEAVDEEETLPNEEEENILSKFRTANINFLSDVDHKYAGRKASRRAVKDSDDESFDSQNDEGVGEDNSEESDEEDSENESETGENESEDEEDSDEFDEEQFGDSTLLDNEEDTNFKHIADGSGSNQMQKAQCVRNQMSMWENLLEVRIQLQKCLLSSNKMPQSVDLPKIREEFDPEFSTKLAETKQHVGGVLDKLLQLQHLLLKQYPETKKLLSKTDVKVQDNDDDDEEIPSDSEPEQSEDETVKSTFTQQKKRKLDDYQKELDSQHKKYKDYRNNVIKKWNDKTRVATMKNANVSHSIINQIEYNLSNKEKLLKRTQLKRSQYEIVGKSNVNSEEEDGEQYDSEIFDDDDFYHQLLRELIEVKSADVTDPVQLGRQWIQLQSLRSKMKRKIDTKATKGRKIRYVVHNKLVNFMGPIDAQVWTDEAKTELYNSLFGK